MSEPMTTNQTTTVTPSTFTRSKLRSAAVVLAWLAPPLAGTVAARAEDASPAAPAAPAAPELGADELAREAARRPLAEPVHLLDASGAIHALEPRSADAARVYVFFMGECPVSRQYVPELKRLGEAWRGREAGGAVSLYGVWADATTPPAEVAEFVEEYGVDFPMLLDRDGELGRRFRPTHVPEAFVLDRTGEVRYRGRIDDLYAELARPRREPTTRDLRDAVAAVAAGREVKARATKPVGCFYETLPVDRVEDADAEVTYHRDVAPILYANCTTCHRDGEVAPFALTSYEDAAKRARQIARVVDDGLMPPWKAGETHGEFVDQRTLTKRQVAILGKWAEGGRAEGDAADAPPLPEFSSEWRLGEPDLVLEMPAEFEVPADGPDVYQNFILPVSIPADRLVATIDFRPGNPAVVHHALLFLDSRGAARKLDARTPEPGYASFGGPGFVPSGSIGGWSPGKSPRRLPNGLGRRLDRGSDVVLQIHYHPSGKKEKDRSRVAIYFADEPEPGESGAAVAIWASAFSHDIPPGAKDYEVEASFTLPSDVLMLGTVPHMHLLGREFRAVAKLPNGSERSLIHIPEWDFDWQDEYHWAEPFELPEGTEIEVSARYDNSSENPRNPNHPPARVTWGEETTDEMLYGFFLVAPTRAKDRLPLLEEVLRREIMGRMAAELGARARRLQERDASR